MKTKIIILFDSSAGVSPTSYSTNISSIFNLLYTEDFEIKSFEINNKNIIEPLKEISTHLKEKDFSKIGIISLINFLPISNKDISKFLEQINNLDSTRKELGVNPLHIGIHVPRINLVGIQVLKEIESTFKYRVLMSEENNDIIKFLNDFILGFDREDFKCDSHIKDLDMGENKMGVFCDSHSNELISSGYICSNCHGIFCLEKPVCPGCKTRLKPWGTNEAL